MLGFAPCARTHWLQVNRTADRYVTSKPVWLDAILISPLQGSFWGKVAGRVPAWFFRNHRFLEFRIPRAAIWGDLAVREVQALDTNARPNAAIPRPAPAIGACKKLKLPNFSSRSLRRFFVTTKWQMCPTRHPIFAFCRQLPGSRHSSADCGQNQMLSILGGE